jgi:hypothetical protein
VREPEGKAPTMRTIARYVMEGSGKGTFLLQGSIKGTLGT